MAAKKKDRDKLRPDVNEVAYRVMLEATGQAPKTAPPEAREASAKNPVAVKRGRKGGKKGGTARKAALSAKERAEIAKRAAAARWKNGRERD